MNSPIEIANLDDYIRRIGNIATAEKSHLYRGQEDAAWRVTSGALRRLQEKDTEPAVSLPYEFFRYLQQIVNEIQLEYPSTYRTLSPLECLAHLQHNGVATGLIDFTFNPLVALWFACAHQKENTDGKVIVLENEREKIAGIETVQELESGLEAFFDINLTQGQWRIWAPALDSRAVDTQRMTRQHSVFLLGLPLK